MPSPWHHLISFKDSGYTNFLGHENSASMFHIIRAPTQPSFTLTGEKKEGKGCVPWLSWPLIRMWNESFEAKAMGPHRIGKWTVSSLGDSSFPPPGCVPRDASRRSVFHIIQFGVWPISSRAEGRFVKEVSNISKCWMARQPVFEVASQVSCNPEARAVNQQMRNHWGHMYIVSLTPSSPAWEPAILSHLRN